MTAPSGQPSPFERQIVTVSASSPSRAAGIPSATDGVRDPGPVEVHREVVPVRRLDDRLELCERPDGAARLVVRVLEREQRGPRGVEPVERQDRRPHLLGREATALTLEAARLQARVHRGAAELGDHDVGGRLDQELAAALAEDRERDLVRHRRRRQEDRLLLSEEGGCAGLEREHGRILPALLVADLGRRDRGAHPGRRPRLRVGAQIDHAAQPRRPSSAPI